MDIKRVEDAAAKRNNTDPEDVPTTFAYKILHAASPGYNDDEDGLDDDDQVIMCKANALGVRRPEHKVKKVPGPWRVARPPPRQLVGCKADFWDWLRSLDNGAPKVVATLSRDVPPHHLHPTQSSAQSSHLTMSSIQTSLPSAGLEALSPRNASPEWIEVTRRRPHPQPSARPIKQTYPTALPARSKSPKVLEKEPDSPRTRKTWQERSPEPAHPTGPPRRGRHRETSLPPQCDDPSARAKTAVNRKECGRPRSRSTSPEASRPRQRHKANDSRSPDRTSPTRMDKDKERAIGERPMDVAAEGACKNSTCN